MNGLHFADENFGAGCVRRRIQNFLSYPVASESGTKSYLATAAALTATRVSKETHICDTSALVCKLGNQDLRELTYYMAPSDRPELWVRLTLVGGNKIDPVVQPDGSLLYRNALDGVDVQLLSAPGRLKETIVINDRKVTALRWRVKQAVELTMRIDRDVAVWSDRDGKAVMETRAPWGHDSSRTALTLDGTQPLRASLTEDHGDLVLTLDADDLGKATLPAVYDPTVVVSGTTDVEDNWMDYTSHNNNGGDVTGYIVPPSMATISFIARCATSAIPSGTIDALRLFMYHFGGNTSGPVCAFIITPANTWVEGSVVGSPQDDSSDWYDCKHGTQAWAGSSCCSTSGVDYDADAAPPSKQWVGAGMDSMNLLVAWATAWRGGRTNNGIVLHMFTGNYGRWALSDIADFDYAPRFEIDYTASASCPLPLLGLVS